VKCSFCDFTFNQNQAETACKSCPLIKGCHLVRCPRCGYEMPPEAKLMIWLRQLNQRMKKQKKSINEY
jgi:hypothetical protein